MILQERIDLMVWLGEYMTGGSNEWKSVRDAAYNNNGWFTPEFIQLSADAIAENFTERTKLINWTKHYHLDDNISAKTIGIIMAGNIPMVGFQDMLCVFISGHKQTIKLSSKDDVLLKHLVEKMISQNNEVSSLILFAEMLKGCDAYIATGSNNSANLFTEYFGKYPNIIRRNRTSVALLNGKESDEELEGLSNDIHRYFGLGCRNVTKLYVPNDYDFISLIDSFENYKYFADHHKYKNNYDYQLSIVLLNNVYYMTNGATLLIENISLFTPVSIVNYEFYGDAETLKENLRSQNDVQCIIGDGFVPFGNSQTPGLFDYADGADVMEFLLGL